jgi:GTPase
VLITSALTGENVEKLFASIEQVQRAARQRIGTGALNRLLRQAFEANPPPLVKGRRLKLFYAAQSRGKEGRAVEGGDPATVELPEMQRARGSLPIQAPEFVLFVNDPSLLNETYRRYLEARIRKKEPYPGLPIILTLRPRAQNVGQRSRLRGE